MLDNSGSIIQTKVHIQSESQLAFAEWQARFHAAIDHFPGFVSLEILAPSESDFWLIAQRFQSQEHAKAWQESAQRKELIDGLKDLLISSPDAFQEEVWSSSKMNEGVTEVFVAQVNPEKEISYRQWIAKIHQIEATFPGFRGVYVQSPAQGQNNWITLLQFDTIENLDHWLSSPEREDLLKESQGFVSSLDRHRMISAYAGWFAKVAKNGVLPPVWKQTMIVLLVLFPIVMLEFKLLLPLLEGLNLSFKTFIGNAISVSLVSWPLTPIAIWGLGWWLAPGADKKTTWTGIAVMILLYLIEIAIFWN